MVSPSTSTGAARAGDSSKLLTGSGDSSAKLWDLETGRDLFSFKFHEPCRAVAFSLGDGMAAISSDPFIGAPAAIHLVTIAGARNLAEMAVQRWAPVLTGRRSSPCACVCTAMHQSREWYFRVMSGGMGLQAQGGHSKCMLVNKSAVDMPVSAIARPTPQMAAPMVLSLSTCALRLRACGKTARSTMPHPVAESQWLDG